ncbi:Sporulation initiation inhibitor protein Soj [Cupriavidus campinensis]|uniref:ParA family protein n=1 Tax=Cupriavidus campinensis TaxID=151783 RepID=A0ABY3EJB7_9BURK|nr:ParA family protein [Cupriavidus campinensis]TSP10985.1 ParA family protein [Cupriavidus campinensis]CAG2138390.1 Sporulation initiation inhibitor protein Soj [Cupriavidus campinensis]
MPKIVTVTNQKGGVGKTTVTCHLAFAAQEAGKRVLVVDFCGQGNASQFLTQDLRINKQRGGAETLFSSNELKFSDTPWDNLKVLHGHLYLEELDKKEDELLKLAIKLRPAIRSLPFDYVIFDTPPALGPRIAGPLFWSDTAILTVQPKLSSITGLDDTFDTIKGVKRINHGLSIRMVVNLFTKSSKTQRRFREDLQKKFGNAIIEEFPLRTPVSDALENFKPVWQHARDKKLGQHWKMFSKRVLDLGV